MDIKTEEPTLFVGEGDFSFSVALAAKLSVQQQSPLYNILATSIETPDTIKKHASAEGNILDLQRKGVEVRLSTDATQLHTDPYFKGKEYSRIVFNFPHSGGKSNLKRNRKLLNDFFASAARILQSRGQVVVTLCKGQGGTPADRPMRKWHDSWQVVSMAANSGFILVKTVPFRSKDYTAYTSTGFRGVDKWFHTDNAVTHVFEQADASVPVPVHVEDALISVDGQTLRCPQYLYQKLLQTRVIYETPNHLIHKCYRHISTELTELMESSRVSTSSNIAISDLGCRKSSCTENKCRLLNCDYLFCDQYSLLICDSNEENVETFQDILVLYRNGATVDGTDKKVYLAKSLLECSGNMLSDSELMKGCVIAYGVVFNRVQILYPNIPPSYSILITWPLSHDQSDKSRDQIDKSHGNVLDTIDSIMECAQHKIYNILQLLKRTFLSFHAEETSLTFNQQMHKGTDDSNKTVYPCGEILYKQGDAVLGHVHLHKSVHGGSCWWSIVFELSLTQLACWKYNIPLDKYLWSTDHRVKEEFERISQCHEASTKKSKTDIKDLPNKENKVETESENKSDNSVCQTLDPDSDADFDNVNVLKEMDKLVINEDCDRHFIAPSVYPLTSVHDMSFWENESIPFDERVFHDIIRSVAGDEVTSVELIDTFTDPISGKRSRCYRLTFLSIDKCLSYDCSWKLQSLIRLEVENYMKIVLR